MTPHIQCLGCGFETPDGHCDKNLASLDKNKSRLEIQLRAVLKYSPTKNVLSVYIDITDEIIETLKKELLNANNIQRR